MVWLTWRQHRAQALVTVAVTLCGLAFGAVVLGRTTVGDPPGNRFAGSVFGFTGIAAGAWFLALFALLLAGVTARQVLSRSR